MIKVYNIIPDVNNFQCFTADDTASLMKIPFDGTRIRPTWATLPVYSPHPTMPEGEFWGCFGNNSIFALGAPVASSICTFLDQSCEVLPVLLDDRELYVCNVIHVLNCLDKARSEHKPGIPGWITRYVFHPNRFDYSLFKLPETRKSEVYCIEGLAAPEDEFKGTVENLGLKGLIFKEVWRH